MKASKLETLGAWLGLWTPPRDVVVPPVPWRKVAAGAAGLGVVAVAFALFAAPAIDDAKDDRAARDQAALDERAAVRRARIRAEQRPRFGTVRAAATRDAALVEIETAIGDDARRRFSPQAAAATCEPAPGIDAAAAKVAYDCVSPTREVQGAAAQEGARGQLGYPYRAIVDFDAGRYAFCRIHPVPGEKAIPDPARAITLPRACLLSR